MTCVISSIGLVSSVGPSALDSAASIRAGISRFQGIGGVNTFDEDELEAKYNINHKRNMLMMPMDKEVGEILDMPRHIQLMEGDAPGLKAEC